MAAKYKAVAVVINTCELVEASLRLCRLSGGSVLYFRDIVTSINIYHSERGGEKGKSGANGDGRGASMFLRAGMQLMTLIREGRRKTKHDLYHRGIGLPRTPFKSVLFSYSEFGTNNHCGQTTFNCIALLVHYVASQWKLKTQLELVVSRYSSLKRFLL